ncbi:NADH-quinone oxidoreductase subunit M [Helicobacter bizzozeronii]|uniref:NADH-quinone oxidoreductase subunit M n=1 Tax=Helicobacter bizzozeronii TaxID=56877 RepID=UPI000CF11648|nr:NADH-quinone oxidoreductase subunit M [Helicobacter bizzozeronii]
MSSGGYLLNLLVFFPLLAALPMFKIGEQHARAYAVVVAGIELLLVLCLWSLFDSSTGNLQFQSNTDLLGNGRFFFILAVDGISLFLVILNALVIFLAALAVYENQKHMLLSLLLLEGILMGVFLAQTLLMFYVFWEVSLLPVLYMIGRFGVKDRVYSGLKFFIYTFLASLIMLVGFLYWAYASYLAARSGVAPSSVAIWGMTFSDFANLSAYIPLQTQFWVFLALFAGIAVKIPIFPFHSWMPHAYGNAPIVGSVVLSALLLKMGTYALVRLLLPLLPHLLPHFLLPLSLLALCMVIYAGILACAQTEMKRLIAYSSMSHMGVALLGLYALNVEGVGGAIFTMFSHGLVSAGLFLLVGMLYERHPSSKIVAYQGVAHSMPAFATCFMFVLLANVGMPLTSGFVGEFLSLLGFFNVSPLITLLAGSTIILSAIYMLNLYRKVFFGVPNRPSQALKDLCGREKFILGTLIAAILFFGIYPKPILTPIEKSVQVLLNTTQPLKDQ